MIGQESFEAPIWRNKLYSLRDIHVYLSIRLRSSGIVISATKNCRYTNTMRTVRSVTVIRVEFADPL